MESTKGAKEVITPCINRREAFFPPHNTEKLLVSKGKKRKEIDFYREGYHTEYYIRYIYISLHSSFVISFWPAARSLVAYFSSIVIFDSLYPPRVLFATFPTTFVFTRRRKKNQTIPAWKRMTTVLSNFTRLLYSLEKLFEKKKKKIISKLCLIVFFSFLFSFKESTTKKGPGNISPRTSITKQATKNAIHTQKKNKEYKEIIITKKKGRKKKLPQNNKAFSCLIDGSFALTGYWSR